MTRSLVSLCAEQGRQVAEVLHRSRAVLNHGFTPDEHLRSAMSAKKRKELRRQRARLEKEDAVSIRRTRGTERLDKWIGEFLALELRGWKGGRGSALASDPRNEQLFRQSLAGAAALGRLERIAMYCGDRPIAMLATFLAEPGAYSFKTSFDEDFARFSPGLLLQVENLALLEDPVLEWCDSCAAVDHPMIERIWRDRREMVWLSIGVGRGLRRKMGELWAKIEAWREERRA
ncbi:GNAT family N-acetyltransferase [Erythrobacter mangrovi]|uniref:GNAT family N-acetyltransferase n=1 Tax=Erythrobacter mangrovi TaxID=2739433 RepID=A0A7D4BSH2_9SPHN|nr:GNAT family N-acetyltransferase [Erythrobacter mangrovi]QKG69967.1 GNAT family N-acetyltransferase [Erythrobacter mangrovi]